MIKDADSRQIALDALLEILEKGAYSHIVLRQALEKYQYLEKQDRALITRLVEGTIEYRLTLDAVLNQCSSVNVKKMKPLIRTLLRMSAYQILFMDRIPDSAVCNEAVKIAVQRKFQGLKGFVNGVLRTIGRKKDSFVFTDWSLKYSMPQWLIDLWKSQYPEAVVETMLQSFMEGRPITVRCNLDQASKAEILESLHGQKVVTQDCPLSDSALWLTAYDYLDGLEAFQKGWIQVQDASSGFVGLIADPKPGEQVLDVCGAPGGKSLHLADLLKGTGMVTVRDLTEGKVRILEANIERAGFTNMCVQQWDALLFDEHWEERADLVIADLPCSGFGIIGKKPDIKYQASPEKVDILVSLQQEMLRVVSRYVKPGGRLIYSTCTVNRRENEDQAIWFRENFPFSSINLEGKLGEQIRESTMKDGILSLIPGQYPCDGFFIAAFQKEDS